MMQLEGYKVVRDPNARKVAAKKELRERFGIEGDVEYTKYEPLTLEIFLKLSNGDAQVQERLNALKEDPELALIFEAINTNGLEAALKYCNDEELMLKLSNKMGGVPA